MNGCLAIKPAHDQIVHLLNGSEFSCRIHSVSAALRIQLASGFDNVACFKERAKLAGRQSDLGPVRAIDLDINPFLLNAPEVNSGN